MTQYGLEIFAQTVLFCESALTCREHAERTVGAVHFTLMLKSNHFPSRAAQGTGDVCSNGEKHNERGHAGMILHHIIDQKMPMSKSERQPFAQKPPWVPQVSPKGPLFWSQIFSNTTPR